jgi:hypothetical protein
MQQISINPVGSRWHNYLIYMKEIARCDYEEALLAEAAVA